MPPPIDLVDGDELAEKLKELALGVKTELVDRVSIDAGWFESLWRIARQFHTADQKLLPFESCRFLFQHCSIRLRRVVFRLQRLRYCFRKRIVLLINLLTLQFSHQR
jgi:hypothetical protein